MSDPKETPVNEQVENEDLRNPADEAPREAAEAATAEESGQQADIIAEKDAEIADLKDKLLRAMAEVENMRRRAEREKQDAHNYAVTKFARDVLSVADNLRRAIDSVPEAARESGDVKNILTGVELTESELLNTMEKHQIRKIDPKGEKFDPNMHQAMFEIEDPSVEPGTVLQVVQAGYSIADRLLRPAMVGVAKGGQKRSETRIDEKV
ncbi:MAG: nucleotide exchange factor GrpE [Sneathiella sp.]|jgi:molecular chaperone GrpE|uniref:nucleotide exchange factor GrpE n=1 Tax=Sneathiella sp. TaxID=1964365 RepID=UPI000C52017C|nr:nucleotide exchange factor GrpE [Sneathiella sp.]MAL79369.1 nucleotide exchange factor GrpE [Sneathiella sp.]|tara:strand:+ start:534 stop:1160 length:627 start_codon:yes stop_codon:yes gene_type:complete